MRKRTIAAALAAAAIAATIPFAYAQFGGSGFGMMGGYGGYGMGPGMMGGYHGYGMGPGMMGGYGGYRGYGMGPGMMWGDGAGFTDGLDLSAAQRETIAKLQEDGFQQRWDLMGKIHQQGIELRQLLASGKPDDAAVGKAYERLNALGSQMRASATETQKQILATLTESQRKQLEQGAGWGPGSGWGRGWGGNCGGGAW